MVPRWQFFDDFLPPIFLASHMQYISDLHSKFAQRPHHGHTIVDIQSATTEIRQGKKEETRMRANAQRDGRPAEYRCSMLQSLADAHH